MQQRRFFGSQTSIVAAILLTTLIAGCAQWRQKGKKNTVPGPGPQQEFTGTITLVNDESRFVLINAGYAATPPADGTALKSFTGDTESGVLSVSPQHRRPFVIADIVSGTPKKGDRVVESIRPSTPTPNATPAPNR